MEVYGTEGWTEEDCEEGFCQWTMLGSGGMLVPEGCTGEDTLDDLIGRGLSHEYSPTITVRHRSTTLV